MRRHLCFGPDGRESWTRSEQLVDQRGQGSTSGVASRGIAQVGNDIAFEVGPVASGMGSFGLVADPADPGFAFPAVAYGSSKAAVHRNLLQSTRPVALVGAVMARETLPRSRMPVTSQ